MTDIERINIVKTKKPIAVLDIIVIALVTVLAVILAVLPLFSKKKGASVVITADGKEQSYSLERDQTVTVKSLTVVIKNGSVKVVKSGCSDHLCEKMGSIEDAREKIVCLPEGVVITIEGESKFQADTGEEV